MPTVQRPSTAIRVAGLSFMLGAWFGVAIPVVLSHLARHGELPMTPWGFRALASPFEQLGPEGFGPKRKGLESGVAPWSTVPPEPTARRLGTLEGPSPQGFSSRDK